MKKLLRYPFNLEDIIALILVFGVWNSAVAQQEDVTNIASEQVAETTLLKKAPSWLKPFDAYYTLYRDGDKSGKGTRSLKQTAQGWELLSTTYAKVFFFSDRRIEKSIFEWDENLHPITYRYKIRNTFKKQLFKENFDWDLKIVKGSRSKKRTWEFPLKEGITDRLSHQLLLREKLIEFDQSRQKFSGSCVTIAKFKPQTFSFEISSKGYISTREYQLVGEERITVDSGSYNTYKLIRTKGTKKTVFWMAKELNYIPVKIYQEKDGDEQAYLVLNKYQAQETNKPVSN